MQQVRGIGRVRLVRGCTSVHSPRRRQTCLVTISGGNPQFSE
jgi:hypothetical protein